MDISLSADDRTLWVDSFMDGMVRVFDVSDPFKPKQIYEKKIGRQLNMVSQSWDGKRLYFTSSLIARWDKQGADNEQFLRAYTWDGTELRDRFALDFTAAQAGTPAHHAVWERRPLQVTFAELGARDGGEPTGPAVPARRRKRSEDMDKRGHAVDPRAAAAWRIARRAGGQRETASALALAAALVACAIGPVTEAWAHGDHSHGSASIRSVSGDSDGPLRARNVRFDFDAPRPGTYRLPVVKPAADGAVLDATGAPRRLRDVLAGKVVVLSFIYTRCSDANGCPLATAVLHQLHAATAGDAELARHAKLVTLSFDPGHDTPETMAKYSGVAAAREPRSAWEFLTTTSDRELAPILAGYGQVIQRPASGPAGPSHLLRVYLIDRQQRIRNIYGLDFLDPRLLIADVRTLLQENRSPSR